MSDTTHRILYMEDDPGLGRLLQKRLECAGNEVDLTQDGATGLALLGEKSYDLLMVDYRMPGMDGLEVLRRLAGQKDIPPLVMLTGAGDEKTAVEAMKLGAADYIIKDPGGAYLDLIPSVAQRVLSHHRLVREKSQAEAALRESEALFRTLVERSLAGVVIVRGTRVVYANPFFCGKLNVASDPLDLLSFVHPQERDMFRLRLTRLAAGEAGPDEWELRLIRTDGEILWGHFLATGIGYRGEPAVLCTVVDITRRKQAEEVLRKNELLNQRLLDSIPHPSLLLRRDRTILAANRMARDHGAKAGDACWKEFGSGGGSGACPQCRADQALTTRETIHAPVDHPGNRAWDTWWIPLGEDLYLRYAVNMEEQKRSEEALRSTEERYRLLLEAVAEGVLLLDASGRMVFANDRFCQASGFSREECLKRPLANFLEDLRGAPVTLSRVVSSGPTSFRAVLRRKDGSRRNVSVTARPAAGSASSSEALLVLMEDITEIRALREARSFMGVPGMSAAMLKIFAEIREAAMNRLPVHLSGEIGTGKRCIATAIHQAGSRAGGRVIFLDCGSRPEKALSSRFFGPEAGETGKPGAIARADGGTLFLERVEELPDRIQDKLLALLEEGSAVNSRSLRPDVRMISASHGELEKAVFSGKFSRELYERLCETWISVPPLRERHGDIPLLVERRIQREREKTSGLHSWLSPEALCTLAAYRWPGNLRELRNVIHFALIKSGGKKIEVHHLPEPVRKPYFSDPGKKRVRKIDGKAVKMALAQAGGNKQEAARLLGVSRSTLYRFMEGPMPHEDR